MSREAQATIADPAAALPSLNIEQLHGATLEQKWQFNAFESGLYRLRSLLNDSPQPSCVALTTAGGLAAPASALDATGHGAAHVGPFVQTRERPVRQRQGF